MEKNDNELWKRQYLGKRQEGFDTTRRPEEETTNENIGKEEEKTNEMRWNENDNEEGNGFRHKNDNASQTGVKLCKWQYGSSDNGW